MRRALLLAPVLFLLAPASSRAEEMTFTGYDVPAETWNEIRREWIEEILATHAPGTWAPLKLELDDARLAKLGLPPKAVLLSRHFDVPTMVSPDGTMVELDPIQFTAAAGPAVASYAGLGCFGIRPGALILVFTDADKDGTDDTVGLCSLAHVYNGNLISTAGHCREDSDGNPTAKRATVIAALGNGNDVTGLVLLDFGSFGTTRDNGIGNDFALISVDSPWKPLLSPTMCFWGGPQGLYRKTGTTLSVSFPRTGQSCRLSPSVSVQPDPLLAQILVHYGHGLGVGAGGTPRIAFSESWGTNFFSFVGAISPGDSGSGANTLPGDGTSVNEAAGIMTHIFVDPCLSTGIGTMAGTRATVVGATLTKGQIVPYPIPASGLP